MKAYIHHLSYEFRAGVRDKSLMLLNYLFPLAFFFLAGPLMSRINPGFVEVVIPAMTLFALMSCFLLGMPSALVTARDAGVLRSFRINGVPGWTSIVMPVIANGFHMAVVTVLIGLGSILVIGAALPQNMALFLLGWVLSVAAMAATGSLISVLSNSSRAATLLAQLVFIPSILLGGLMMPPEVLPEGLGRVAKLWPAAHAMAVFRGGDGWEVSAIVLAVGSVFALVAALWLYEWDPRNLRRAKFRIAAVAALVPYVISAIVT